MCVFSLSLSFKNPFVFARARIGWNERATERLKAPFAFGSSGGARMRSLRFFIFFSPEKRENSPLFAFFWVKAQREMCCAMMCVWWDAKIRTGGCDCFCIAVNVFFADIMVVSWCGVLRAPWNRRRDDGRVILVLKERKTFWGLCVCKCLLQQKT